MVTPSELLELARRLLSDNTEITDRSAVSRAYYAAFWHSRRIVENRVGPIDTIGPDIHREVADQLALLDVDASDMLFDLRVQRNAADYAPERHFGRAGAVIAIDMAGMILTSDES